MHIYHVFYILSTCILCVCSLPYTVLIDAGSSGSRVRVYYQNPRYSQVHPESLRQTYAKKIKPGLSAFASASCSKMKVYLKKLIDASANNISKVDHNQTEIFVMATAGKMK